MTYLIQLQGASYFYKIGLHSMYHQLRVEEDDILKMAFRTPMVILKFLIMSFRLTKAPVNFIDLMNRVLKPYLDMFVVV